MEPLEMDFTMELICRLRVVNRRGDVIKDLSMGSVIVTSMSRNSTPSEESFITIRTSSDDTGTKYNLIGNIEDLVIEFLNEGQVTVCLKEPSCNIIITNADPDELIEFIFYLKAFLPKDSPLHVSLEPYNPQIILYLECQEKYKIRMENIIDMNTNLNLVSNLNICDCTLELAGYQVPIADAIKKMKNLETLHLERIELLSSTFLEIESKKLKQLHLCDCEIPLPIASLFKNDLCYKDSLVELQLEGNDWPEITNAIFEFPNLLKLLLSDNRIIELPDKFNNLPKLQVLDLSCNQLTHVPPSIFALQNLSELSLISNLITELPNTSTNSSKLQVLFLSYNQLRTLPPSFFEFLNLSELSLNNNHITELPDMFAKLSKLRKLVLSHNQLRSVPPSIFQLQNLSVLLLGTNFITELPNIINLPKLEFLLLANNQLRYLPANILSLQNLYDLSLSDNLITELPDMFANLPKLKVLSLSNNQLQYLPPSVFTLHLRQLDATSNLFNFEIPPAVGSELIVHSLKELSYRTILNHKLKVKEGMLPMELLKDLDNYRQCICGRKFVAGQDLLFFCNLSDILSFTYNRRHLRVPVGGKMCNSLKSCFLDRFTKCR